MYTDPTGHWPEWLDNALEFAQGAAYQFTNDMTLGSVDKVATAFAVCMDCNASDAYKQGQQAGRAASTVVSSAEFVVGAAATGAAIAAMPATAGGGLACAGLTAGLCALPAGAALTAEGAIAVGGVAVAGHGTATMAYMTNNPLTGRNPWSITSENTDRVMYHDKFGTFYRAKSDGLWWTRDQAGHGGSIWKIYRETSKGLEWYADADLYGDFIAGKYKGRTGKFISWKELSGR